MIKDFKWFDQQPFEDTTNMKHQNNGPFTDLRNMVLWHTSFNLHPFVVNLVQLVIGQGSLAIRIESSGWLMAGLQSYIHHLKVDVNENTKFEVEETGFLSKFVLPPSTVLSSRQISWSGEKENTSHTSLTSKCKLCNPLFALWPFCWWRTSHASEFGTPYQGL